MYIIGNDNDIKQIDKDNIPINNFPIIYFPFHFNNDNTINKMKNYSKKLFDYYNNKKSLEILGNLQCSDSSEVSSGTDLKLKCVNMDKLLNSITNMELKSQPYNNNNIKIILLFIILIWISILMIILKIGYYYFNNLYTYFIISLTIILLIISIIYSFIITGRNF